MSKNKMGDCEQVLSKAREVVDDAGKDIREYINANGQ
jgi:hypothetical protein